MQQSLSIDLLNESGVLVVINARAMGNVKKITDYEKVLKAGIKGVGAFKDYIHKDYLKGIVSLQNMARSYLGGLTVAIKFDLLNSVFFVPFVFLDDVRTHFALLIQQHNDLVDSFVSQWEAIKVEARERLDLIVEGLYNPKDYDFNPRDKFGLNVTELQITNFGENELTKELNSFSNSVGVVLRKKMADLLDSAVKSFTIDYADDGTPTRGKLADNLFIKMNDLFKLVDQVNGKLTHDSDLAAIVSRVRKVITDEHDIININKNKKDDDWRLDMGDKFADIHNAFKRSTSPHSVEFFDESEN